MRAVRGGRRIAAALLATALCAALAGCQRLAGWWLAPSDHTELVEDGVYQPFNVPRKTMEKLMELVEAEDAAYIYEVFSPRVRAETADADLEGQIGAFIRFCREKVTSWDFDAGTEHMDRSGGVTTSSRVSLYTFEAASGTYRCDINDVRKDSMHPDVVGFTCISVFPEELVDEYGPDDPEGVRIVYRATDVPPDAADEPDPLEALMRAAEERGAEGVYELFSLNAKRRDEALADEAAALAEFLGGVEAAELCSWTRNRETVWNTLVTAREMFFYLRADGQLYRCDIREVLDSPYPEADVGFSSVAVFPAKYPGVEADYEDEAYREMCTWGRDNAGIRLFFL